MKTLIITCEQCKKKVYKKPSKIYEYTFCSIECMGKWRKNNPEYKKTLVGRNTKKRNLNKYIVEGEITKIITKNRTEIIIDTDDITKVNKYTWRVNKNGYAITEFRKDINKTKRIQIHRLINNTPNGLSTDHINRNRLDNRKCNLRSCTSSQNAMNVEKYRGKTSKAKGVDYVAKDKSWRARISKNGVRITLGYFKNEEDAIKERLKAEKEVFGEFSPNFFGEL